MQIQKLFILSSSIAALLSCARLAGDMARETAPAVAESTLETAAKPENKEHIQEIVDSVIERLAAPQNTAALDQVTKRITNSMAHELAAPSSPAIRQEREAAAATASRIAVKAAIEELKRSLPGLIKEVATRQDVIEAVTPLTKSAAGSAVKGATEGVTK